MSLCHASYACPFPSPCGGGAGGEGLFLPRPRSLRNGGRVGVGAFVTQISEQEKPLRRRLRLSPSAATLLCPENCAYLPSQSATPSLPYKIKFTMK